MDGHEVYAGKRVAELKAQFLQHEYTWSDHCITGNKLGWGVTASSVPASREILREVEKLAADTEPDRMEGIPVEELIYSPVTGFTRMCTLPLEQGEDGRNNKLVKILQTIDPDCKDPAVYFAGMGQAFAIGPERSGLVPEKALTAVTEDPDQILIEMGLRDKLSVFLRAIFWSLLEYPGSLNIVAAGWDKKDFADKAARLMYAVHCMLPENLRPKAGYRSYAWKENKGTAFYFSKEVYGRACFELDRAYEAASDSSSDQLADYCFDTLARYWMENPELYHKAMEEVSAYLEDHSGKGMELKKVQWIIYDFARREGEGTLPDTFLLQNLPELLYWGSREEKLHETADRILADIHKKELEPDQEDLYIRALLEKVSNRSLADICNEIEYILKKKDCDEYGEAEDLLRMIKDKNVIIYQCIYEDFSEEDEWRKLFLRIDQDGLPHEPFLREEEDQHEPPSFLQNALRRRGEDGELLEESQVEGKNKAEEEGVAADFVTTQDSEDEQNTDEKPSIGKSKRKKRNRTEANYRVLSSEEEPKNLQGNGKEFVLSSLPTGFLTGCVIFMTHYSLMIGHWKIAVGMIGMWLILILNYAWLLKKIQPARHLWMGIGLCLVTGDLIAIVADYFVRQEYRIIYFTILGVIAATIQVVRVVREVLQAKTTAKSVEEQK